METYNFHGKTQSLNLLLTIIPTLVNLINLMLFSFQYKFLQMKKKIV